MLIATTTDDFPLGPTGKVLKRELRTRHAALLTEALRPRRPWRRWSGPWPRDSGRHRVAQDVLGLP
ncbi:MAG: hypothetical protein R2734_08160 [Nocardioides sp.]